MQRIVFSILNRIRVEESRVPCFTQQSRQRSRNRSGGRAARSFSSPSHKSIRPDEYGAVRLDAVGCTKRRVRDVMNPELDARQPCGGRCVIAPDAPLAGCEQDEAAAKQVEGGFAAASFEPEMRRAGAGPSFRVTWILMKRSVVAFAGNDGRGAIGISEFY